MKLLDISNKFYNDRLGYKPENTKLIQIPRKNWTKYTIQNDLNPNSSGVYLPRNQTAIVQENEPLSLFHEYFGHGMYCEYSQTGRLLVSLEKKLLYEETEAFTNRKFSRDELIKFRLQNNTFQKINRLQKENLTQYELFAIWTEYLLSVEYDMREDFAKKYDSVDMHVKQAIDNIINYSLQYGNLATFYENGLLRKTTAERVKHLLTEIYGENTVNQSKLIILTGSRKPFSDIDIFVSSNHFQSVKNDWLDMIAFNEKDFERRVRLFEIQVTHPIVAGEFVAGDFDYFNEKRRQLQLQPITEEAIEHNFYRARKNEKYAEECEAYSTDWKASLSYAKTYLANALMLKGGKRLLTKEELEAVSF